MNGMEDVRRIQDGLAVVTEQLMEIRRQLRGFREQVLETPSYQLSQTHANGEDPVETVGLGLHGSISEAIGKLDETAHELVNASRAQWEEADYALIPPMGPDAKLAKERN
jgi:hypothetical protein